ncbi:MAG: HD domain-containing protein [Dehalococcoidia bacterium]
MLNDVINIRDAIHGFISLNELEKKIVQQPHFQRLRFIRQLGTTDWVYPGAVHSRFEHSLGVFHLASLVVDRIRRYLRLTDQDVEIFKVACLLHDIGHGPFSHVLEEASLFEAGLDHEKMGQKIINKTRIGRLLTQELGEGSCGRLNYIVRGKDAVPTSRADVVFHELLAGQAGIDRMDYLLRDSHLLGVRYGYYDLNRLLETLRYDDNDGLYWEEGGIHALEQFILARYFMFMEVYFHKTRRVLDHHLGRLIKDYLRSRGKEFLPTNVNEYLGIFDSVLLLYMMSSEGWKNVFLNRHFLRLKRESPEHPEPEEVLIWEDLEKELKKNYSNDDVFFDKAKNDPYKFETVEQIRVYCDRKVRSLTEASLLVRSLRPINKMRVYMVPGKVREITRFIDNFFKNKRAG